MRKTRRKSSPMVSGRAKSSQNCSDGVRAGELSKQALKIFQQIANDGSSQYLYLFVASSAVLSRGGSRFLEAPVQALGGGDGGGGLRGGVAAGGAGVFGRGGRGAFWIPFRLW